MLQRLAPMVARRIEAHQHRQRHCAAAHFVAWNSFVVHGFGSQLQSLRIGLEYGFRTNRIVVQNSEFEAKIVKEDIQLRFGRVWTTSNYYWDDLQSENGLLNNLSSCEEYVRDHLDDEQALQQSNNELLPHWLVQLHPVE